MITEPLDSPDLLDVKASIAEFADETFTSEAVRAVISSAALSVEAAQIDESGWAALVDLGYAGVGFDDADEGLGSLAQCAIGRALGARLAPVPYLSTVFAGAAVHQAAPDQLHSRLDAVIDASAAGSPAIAALVLGHGAAWNLERPGVTAHLHDDGWLLDGAVELVLDAAVATTLLVLARIPHSDGWGLFVLEPAGSGVHITPVETVDATRSFARVEFNSATAEAVGAPLNRDDVCALVDRLAVALSAAMIGSAVACLELTIAYLKTRHQFGRPIGSFQALKHRVADLAVDATVAQELVFSAAYTADRGERGELAIAAPLALARTAQTFRRIAEEGIQLHGGIGFADELMVGLYYKRAISDLELLAFPDDAYARLDAVRG